MLRMFQHLIAQTMPTLLLVALCTIAIPVESRPVGWEVKTDQGSERDLHTPRTSAVGEHLDTLGSRGQVVNDSRMDSVRTLDIGSSAPDQVSITDTVWQEMGAITLRDLGRMYLNDLVRPNFISTKNQNSLSGPNDQGPGFINLLLDTQVSNSFIGLAAEVFKRSQDEWTHFSILGLGDFSLVRNAEGLNVVSTPDWSPRMTDMQSSRSNQYESFDPSWSAQTPTSESRPRYRDPNPMGNILGEIIGFMLHPLTVTILILLIVGYVLFKFIALSSKHNHQQRMRR